MKQALALLLVWVSICTTHAQEQTTPLLSPRAYVKTKHVDISYGQPSVRGRVIFGELVPYGQVWRAGANEATEITFRRKATLAGVPVDTGTYSFFVIPAEKEWLIILNKQLGQWGAYEYDKHKDKDVLKAPVPVQSLSKPQEKLNYKLSKKTLTISWDKTSVSIPLIIN
ncbi:hypothetical protein CAP35_03325 [Chitinophagaceae bacterium IBVUCB1]|nr:hypothetical protein CAP35_03325 [Chitinophagaceae bacterium IBVUCB1]